MSKAILGCLFKLLVQKVRERFIQQDTIQGRRGRERNKAQ